MSSEILWNFRACWQLASIYRQLASICGSSCERHLAASLWNIQVLLPGSSMLGTIP
jgi:hypothetical protein